MSKASMKEKRIGRIRDYIRPLSVGVFRNVKRVSNGSLRAFCYGDTHHGYQDDKTLAVVQAIMEDHNPHVVVDMGDGVDAGMLSDKFRQDPMRSTGLQYEIDEKRKQLARFRSVVPDAEYWYLEGNHEERLRRTLWNLEGPAKALVKLNVVQDKLTWPVLLSTEALGINFVSYDDQTQTKILPKFITKHGTMIRPASGNTAHAELRKYGRSGASGHTHRLGAVWRRDHHGQHVWIETGCCANLRPEYEPDPDWQNGCVVLTFDEKTAAVSVEPVEIRNGHTIWRGKVYKA